MNRAIAYSFDTLDDNAFEMTDRLLDLLTGDTDLDDLEDDALIDLDDDLEQFELH